MPDSDDLDDPFLVDLLTWTLYLGWLAILGSVALWLGVPPLPSIAEAFVVPWRGQVAAVGAAVGFLAAAQQVFTAFKPKAEPRDGP